MAQAAISIEGGIEVIEEGPNVITVDSPDDLETNNSASAMQHTSSSLPSFQGNEIEN